jgi:prepilin-type processing-associated H-X9-DG protein
MLPQVPSESGTTPWTALGGDFEWAALGLDGPPSISLDVTIQSSSTDGADRMLTLVKGLYAWAVQYNEARLLLPELDQLLERLTPRKQGRRLLLQIDSAAANSLIDDIWAPYMVQLRSAARRKVCGTNLSNIGKSLLIYSNDYDDTLPPDLETLIHKAEMPARGLICPATGSKDSYIYRGASLTTSAEPWMVTVYEKQGHHAGGRNVLFLDTHVEWVSEERFQELIEKDNEYRRQKKLPVLPAQ